MDTPMPGLSSTHINAEQLSATITQKELEEEQVHRRRLADQKSSVGGQSSDAHKGDIPRDAIDLHPFARMKKTNPCTVAGDVG